MAKRHILLLERNGDIWWGCTFPRKNFDTPVLDEKIRMRGEGFV